MYDVKISTEVSSEVGVIPLADVKSHLYITHTNDDTYLETLIGKARRMVENYTNRAIGSQTRLWTADLEWGGEYRFPGSPVVSVTSVTVKDDINSYEALTVNDDYEIEDAGDKLFRCFTTGRYKITFTCGFTSSTLPSDLKQSILCQIAYLYENRGDVQVKGLSELAMALADGYKDYSWM
jgi:uncharacterized phiE125 gp8 family phage protein